MRHLPETIAWARLPTTRFQVALVNNANSLQSYACIYCQPIGSSSVKEVLSRMTQMPVAQVYNVRSFDDYNATLDA